MNIKASMSGMAPVRLAQLWSRADWQANQQLSQPGPKLAHFVLTALLMLFIR